MSENRGHNGDQPMYEAEDFSNWSIVELIQSEIRQLAKERSQYPSTSETYMVLTQRITEATEELRNVQDAENSSAQKILAMRNKNMGIYQTLGTVVGNIAGNTIGALINKSNVDKVVNCEQNGGIVKSSAMKFIK